MNKFFERIGHAITSMAALIFALMLTILAMTFFSQTLFYKIFPPEMIEWEKIVASYVLALAWELTVLLTTANVSFLNRRVPIVMAICSGVILLFFIHAFDADLSGLEYFKRWFIGLLVATINMVFAGLFYSKWKNMHFQKDLNAKLLELELAMETQANELANTQAQLVKAKVDFDQLFIYTEELETFKTKEMEKLICPFCKTPHENIYKLTSHKGVCQNNPKKGLKQSIFEEI